MTDRYVAKKALEHFNPKGLVLEPAKGTGSFYDQIRGKKDWCEITQGRDFFDYEKKVDWIITNPPYSIYDRFLIKCFEVADNVVLLVPLVKAFKSRKIDKEIEKYGGLKEVLMLGSGTDIGFKFGFPVDVCITRGDIKEKSK